MKHQFSLISASGIAWADFIKNWSSWLLLAFGGLLLSNITFLICFFFPEHEYLVTIGLIFPTAIYTALLYQNGLDAVHHRKLSMFQISPSILFTSLFFIAISIYSPFFEYSVLFVSVLPDNYQFLIIFNCLVYILVAYFLVRCMFIGMILLEEKCTVLEAFYKSLRLTSQHLVWLFFIFLYLAIILEISELTIIGYLVVLPHAVIMKALLFKYLNQPAQA